MSTAWDNARRHARALESALDTKLSTYSRLATDIATGSGSRSPHNDDEGQGGYRLVEEEIDELLQKVRAAWWCLQLVALANPCPARSSHHRPDRPDQLALPAPFSLDAARGPAPPREPRRLPARLCARAQQHRERGRAVQPPRLGAPGHQVGRSGARGGDVTDETAHTRQRRAARRTRCSLTARG